MLFIDSSGFGDVRNLDDNFGNHGGSDFCDVPFRDKSLNDGACALNSIFWVDDNGDGYNYKPEHGDARYNHDGGDLNSRWDNLNQY
jgi:hypothetical protein